MLDLKQFEKTMNSLSDFGKAEFVKEIATNGKLLKRNLPGVKELAKSQKIINLSDVDPTLDVEKPYLLTTQNQTYLDKTLPSNVESAFCIMGAGNTIFELIYRDVKRIVAVDTSDLQSLIFKLHSASLKTLSVKDYEKFLIDVNNSMFMSPDVFRTVKNGFGALDLKGVNYWENL